MVNRRIIFLPKIHLKNMLALNFVPELKIFTNKKNYNMS